MKQILSLLMLWAVSTAAQNYKIINKTDRAIEKGRVKRSICQLEKAAQDDEDDQYLQYKLGRAYSMDGQYSNALMCYERAEARMKDSLYYYLELFHIHSLLGLYKSAQESYIKYLAVCRTCVVKDLLPGNSSNKLLYQKERSPIRIGSLGPVFIGPINAEEIGLLNQAQLSQNKREKGKYYGLTDKMQTMDKTLTFEYKTSMRGNGGGTLWGPFTINKEGNKACFTRWDKRHQRAFLYYTEKGEKGWGHFRSIHIDKDDGKANFMHPIFLNGGKRIVFSSDISGGLGKYDLWIGEIDRDLFIKNIRNLGPYVNTPGNEVYPSPLSDELIFFSSDGHYGMGGLDIYAGIMYKGKFRKTFNLGRAFNTEWDEFGLYYDAKIKRAYFCSDRPDTAENNGGLYSQEFIKQAIQIHVLTETKAPIGDAQVMMPGENRKLITNENGRVTIRLSPLEFKYFIAQADHYFDEDSLIMPFESNATVRLKKKPPRDRVMLNFQFSDRGLTLFPLSITLRSKRDAKVYCAQTNENGEMELYLYADEKYDLCIPRIGYTEKDICFTSNSVRKINLGPVEIANQKERDIAEANPNRQEFRTQEEPYIVLYDNETSSIPENQKPFLHRLATQIIQNPEYSIDINAHADCQGEGKKNMLLSRERWRMMRQFMFALGVPEKQMSGGYWGESAPRNQCKCDKQEGYDCPMEDLRQNRRVEIRILKKP